MNNSHWNLLKKAIKLRFPDIKIIPNLGDLLIPTRPEDKSGDLWIKFNIIQEKIN